MPPRLLTLVAATTSLLAGCALSTEPAGRVDVTVAVSRDTLVQLTDTLVIQVRALNPTTDTLRFDGGGCLLQFEIHDADGQLVAPDLLACPAVLRHVRLAPGDSLTARFQWYGERWTSRISPPPPELLPGGRYQIFGILDAIGDRQRSQPQAVALLVRTAAR